jgi:hypothetical protein
MTAECLAPHHHFAKQDVTRAVSAVLAAGERVQRVEIEKTGKIVIVTGDVPSNSSNEWDDVP